MTIRNLLGLLMVGMMLVPTGAGETEPEPQTTEPSHAAPDDGREENPETQAQTDPDPSMGSEDSPDEATSPASPEGDGLWQVLDPATLLSSPPCLTSDPLCVICTDDPPQGNGNLPVALATADLFHPGVGVATRYRAQTQEFGVYQGGRVDADGC